jgi:hypothetical protein
MDERSEDCEKRNDEEEEDCENRNGHFYVVVVGSDDDDVVDDVDDDVVEWFVQVVITMGIKVEDHQQVVIVVMVV